MCDRSKICEKNCKQGAISVKETITIDERDAIVAENALTVALQPTRQQRSFVILPLRGQSLSPGLSWVSNRQIVVSNTSQQIGRGPLMKSFISLHGERCP